MADKIVPFPGRRRSAGAVTPDSVLSDLIGTNLVDVVVSARRASGGIIVAASSEDVDRALELLEEARERLRDVKRKQDGE